MVTKSMKGTLWRNSHGFTLAEMMIVVGLVGIMTLALGSLTTITTKSLLTARAGTDFGSLQNLMSTSLVNDTSCSATITVAGAITLALNSVNPVTLNIGGTTVAAGSTYGSLTMTAVNLVINSAGSLVPTTTNKWNFNASIVITAKKPGLVGTGSQAYGAQSLSNQNAPAAIVLQVTSGPPLGATGTFAGCYGLRMGNNLTPWALPTCTATQSMWSDGVNTKCTTTLCANGLVPVSTDVSGNLICSSYPACAPQWVANLPTNPGGTTTIAVYSQMIPVLTSLSTTGYQCKIVSCPQGSSPTYDGSGNITSCVTGQLPMECSAANAACCVSGGCTAPPSAPSPGNVGYWNYSCNPPNYAPQTNNYFCLETCTNKTMTTPCYLGPSGVNAGSHTTSQCVATNGTPPPGHGAAGSMVVTYSDMTTGTPASGSLNGSNIALTLSLAGGWTAPTTYYCRMYGNCAPGWTSSGYYMNKVCCPSNAAYNGQTGNQLCSGAYVNPSMVGPPSTTSTCTAGNFNWGTEGGASTINCYTGYKDTLSGASMAGECGWTPCTCHGCLSPGGWNCSDSYSAETGLTTYYADYWSYCY